MKKLLLLLMITILSLSLCACEKKGETVVVYTSVDRNYSEIIFKDFEEETGIKVLAVYDTEASKTTGMVNRLIEEKDNPIADVFWNGEFSQTILLKEKGVLTPYESIHINSIKDSFKDPEGYWVAFGGRARCLLVNTDLLDEDMYPSSIKDLLSEVYEPSQIGMAYPMFGTTATHASALFSLWGETQATMFFEALNDRGVRVVDGNGAVRDLVVSGALQFGITDTDDAISALKRDAPVKIVFLDQGTDQMGTLFIPNSAAMIKGTDNQGNAAIFLDYLYSETVERKLLEIGWSQVSQRDVGYESPYFDVTDIKEMAITLDSVYMTFETTKKALSEVFVR